MIRVFSRSASSREYSGKACSAPGRPEEVRLGAGGQDEVVAGVRLAAARRRRPRHRIDGDDLGALRIERVEFGGDLAQRVGDVAGRQHRGRDLVQERLELVVVVLVDERDVQVRALGQVPGTGHAGKPATDDHDPLAVGLSADRVHGRLAVLAPHACSGQRGTDASRPTRRGGADSMRSVRRLARSRSGSRRDVVDGAVEVVAEGSFVAPRQPVVPARVEGILGDGPDDLLESLPRIGRLAGCGSPADRRSARSGSQHPRSTHHGRHLLTLVPQFLRSSRWADLGRAASRIRDGIEGRQAQARRWGGSGPHHTPARSDCLPRDALRADC